MAKWHNSILETMITTWLRQDTQEIEEKQEGNRDTKVLTRIISWITKWTIQPSDHASIDCGQIFSFSYDFCCEKCIITTLLWRAVCTKINQNFWSAQNKTYALWPNNLPLTCVNKFLSWCKKHWPELPSGKKKIWHWKKNSVQFLKISQKNPENSWAYNSPLACFDVSE